MSCVSDITRLEIVGLIHARLHWREMSLINDGCNYRRYYWTMYSTADILSFPFCVCTGENIPVQLHGYMLGENTKTQQVRIIH